MKLKCYANSPESTSQFLNPVYPFTMWFDQNFGEFLPQNLLFLFQ